MKIKFSFFLFLVACAAQAKFHPAAILFNDGHTEQGYVKSFLENKFIDFGIVEKLETDLNMNDRNLKFKTDENGEVRTIAIDDVNEITVNYKDGTTETFKVLYLRNFDRNGILKESKYKMWFPLIKKGKINVYGYKYVSRSTSEYGTLSEKDYVYYFQNSKKNYATNPFGDIDELTLLSGGIEKTMNNFYADVFSDCPDYIGKIESAGTWREQKTKRKEKAKQFEGVTTSSVLRYFEVNFYNFSDAFTGYERYCPN
jgi:hypothetical protein